MKKKSSTPPPTETKLAFPTDYVVVLAKKESAECSEIRALLQSAGLTVVTASTFTDLKSLLHEHISVIIVDSQIPGWPGAHGPSVLLEKYSDTSVIVSSADRTARRAIEALTHGAFWYLSKPHSAEDLLFVVQRACVQWELRRDNRSLKSHLTAPPSSLTIVAKSPQMIELVGRLDRIAGLDSTVLLTGESGTGKSTLARLIHQRSQRNNKPFVSMSCAAIPRDLLEAELFGHEKGAFTGAVQSRPGLVETANEGTLFLDEIGDMPLELQPKLLTLLQERRTRRIGSAQERSVNVRIIAATNRNLTEMCAKHTFREDLYFRLNVMQLEVPPLRERPLDIEEMVRANLQKIADRRALSRYAITPAGLQALQAYPWPGNVRELENVLERATAFCKNQTIDRQDLSLPELSAKPAQSSVSIAGLTLDEIEVRAINETLQSTKGNKVEAARILGISLKSIYNKLSRATAK